MIKDVLKYGLLFVICVVLQVLMFDRIYMSGYLNIYFYVLFILLLPVRTPAITGMGLAFLLGLSIDMFSNTPGMHTSASVLVAFIRPSLLKLLSPADGYEAGMEARVSILGPSWFIRYSLILILAHHTWLLYLEAFNFSLFFFTLLKVLLSTFATGFILFISQFLFFKK